MNRQIFVATRPNNRGTQTHKESKLARPRSANQLKKFLLFLLHWPFKRNQQYFHMTEKEIA